MEAGTSAHCSPGFFSLTRLLCCHGHRGLPMRMSWGNLCAPWWTATRHKYLCHYWKKSAMDVCFKYAGVLKRVCTLPCGHVVGSVACGWRERKEKRCEWKLDVWTCQDLSLRSLRCTLHTASEAFEACHLSATAGLLNGTNKTHIHTHLHTHTHTHTHNSL